MAGITLVQAARSPLAIADTKRARRPTAPVRAISVGAAGAVRQVTTSWLDGQPEPDRRGNIDRDAHTSADEGAGQRVCHRCRARDERFGYRLRQQEALVRVLSPERSVKNLECSEQKATSEHSSTYDCGGITGAHRPSRPTFEARLSPYPISFDEPMVITRSNSCCASVHRNSRRESQLVQKNWEQQWSLIRVFLNYLAELGELALRQSSTQR